ncbi:hypothetical protein Nmel_007024 [Mimus melanotis]
MPVFSLYCNLLLSQWNLMLPVFIKIHILTNKSLSTPFEDGGNELSLYEPMKNSLQAGTCSVILKCILSYPFFSFSIPLWCIPHNSVHSVTLCKQIGTRPLQNTTFSIMN